MNGKFSNLQYKFFIFLIYHIKLFSIRQRHIRIDSLFGSLYISAKDLADGIGNATPLLCLVLALPWAMTLVSY